MSPPSTSRVRRRSFGAEAEVCPGRTRLIASWALACGRLEPRLLQHRAAVRVDTQGHGYAGACKERPFLDHSTRNGPGSPPGPGPEQRESLVRLSGWTARRKSSNRRGHGSEQRTRPPTSARSARSLRWSTRSSRSERGCSCPTRSSGRDVRGLSLLLRARRFPSGPIRPRPRQARSEDAAGAGRRCSRGSCSLQGQRPAASSVESTRRYPGSKLGCGR